MGAHNVAILREDSPFKALFPRGVPIKNILVPDRAECIGDGVQDVYMVDLDELTAEQFDQVARLVVAQIDPNYSLDLAKKEMRANGLPLRAKHVQTVSSNLMYFL